MTKLLKCIGMMAALIAGAAAQAGVPAGRLPASPPQLASGTQQASQARHWSTGAFAASQAKTPMRQAPVTEPDGITPSASSWGSAFTPEGVEWLYTIDYEKEVSRYIPAEENGGFELIEYSIVAADITLYNERMEQEATFTVTLPPADETADPGEVETSINLVELSPLLTRKFFHINDAIEAMVFVHATTANNNGHYYTQVYSINDRANGTFHVCTIPGNHVGAVSTPRDEWDETYTLAFMREEFVEEPDGNEKYNMAFDIYHKAAYFDTNYPDVEFSKDHPTLLHTFTVDYEHFSGAGDAALPLLMSAHGGKPYYALPSYEKPFFVSFEQGLADGTYQSWTDYLENPATNEDNNFVIDLYDWKFDKVSTTRIPMTNKEGYMWSFPGMGLLMGHDDLSFGLFGSGDKPCYVVGWENYVHASDDFMTDLIVYDVDGNLVATIMEECADYIGMSDVPGSEKQYCFYVSNRNMGEFVMIDLPSCRETARIDVMLDDTSVTTDFDRVKAGSSYMYVTSLSTADVDDDGGALHRIAWFNADGTLNRVEKVKLGNDVAMAQAYINSEALNPYLFNTDQQMEYLFLVKAYRGQGSSATEEQLRVYSADGSVLLNVGPDAKAGQWLSSVFLLNADKKCAKLITVYNSDEGSNIRHYELPLLKYAGGNGTADNPYLIANAGDLMSIHMNPAAHFRIVNDINFDGYEWAGNDCQFTGSLDGQGYTIRNLHMTGPGIFNSICGGGKVENFYINTSEAAETASSFVCGDLVGEMVSETAHRASAIQNVYVFNSTASAQSFGAIAHLVSNFGRVAGCYAKDVQIECPNGVAGGIVAMLGPGAEVEACAFDGSIEADIAGGIAGQAYHADTRIVNCHSAGTVDGGYIAGGIIGKSMRGPVVNCLGQAAVTANGSEVSIYKVENTQANAGGIIGWVETYFEGNSKEDLVAEGNVSAGQCTANQYADVSVSHAVVGSTSAERMEPNPEKESADGSYVLELGAPELKIGDNYAIVEQPGVYPSSYNALLDGIQAGSMQSIAAKLEWPMGDSIEAPWKAVGEAYTLYFEDYAPSGIVGALAPAAAIEYDGEALRADGVIDVYDVAGAKVATGYGVAGTSALQPGVYIAKAAGGQLKFAK